MHSRTRSPSRFGHTTLREPRHLPQVTRHVAGGPGSTGEGSAYETPPLARVSTHDTRSLSRRARAWPADDERCLQRGRICRALIVTGASTTAIEDSPRNFSSWAQVASSTFWSGLVTASVAVPDRQVHRHLRRSLRSPSCRGAAVGSVPGRATTRALEAAPMPYVRRFDHVGITVADLDTVTAFFVGLGLEVEGTQMFVEGAFLDTVIGIPDSRTEIVMLRPPDGGTRLELSSFVRPDHEPGSPAAMANELGLRNVAFESMTSRRPSTGWPRTATAWSAASVSTSTSGAWPTCADRRGSSCPWLSGSADAPSRSRGDHAGVLQLVTGSPRKWASSRIGATSGGWHRETCNRSGPAPPAATLTRRCETVDETPCSAPRPVDEPASGTPRVIALR